MPSASVPSFEDEKSCQQKKQKTDRVVPFQPFFEVKRRKDCKNRKGNNFLHDFKLRGGKIVMTDAVGGNLKAIFEKGYSPAGQNHDPQGGRFVFEVAVPGKGHENI